MPLPTHPDFFFVYAPDEDVLLRNIKPYFVSGYLPVCVWIIWRFPGFYKIILIFYLPGNPGK